MSKKKPTGKQKGSAPKRVDSKALEIVHPDAAGIDVGGSEHWVAISPDRDPEPVRRFGCFTADVREMGRWLVEKGVRSVAMQSICSTFCDMLPTALGHRSFINRNCYSIEQTRGLYSAIRPDSRTAKCRLLRGLKERRISTVRAVRCYRTSWISAALK